MKRYGYTPKTIELKEGTLNVDSRARAYIDYGQGLRKMFSAWHAKQGILEVQINIDNKLNVYYLRLINGKLVDDTIKTKAGDRTDQRQC